MRLADSLGLVTLLLYVAGETGQGLAVALLLLVGDFAPSLLGPFTGSLSGLGGGTLSHSQGDVVSRLTNALQPAEEPLFVAWSRDGTAHRSGATISCLRVGRGMCGLLRFGQECFEAL
jgi:hypothetical protein